MAVVGVNGGGGDDPRLTVVAVAAEDA